MICVINEMQKSRNMSVSLMPTRNVSRTVASSMKETNKTAVPAFETGDGLLGSDLMNIMFTQMSMMVAKVLDMTLPIVSNMLLCSNGTFENRMKMIILITNIPEAIMRSHFRYGDDLRLFFSELLPPNILVMATMHQPIISVVSRVEMACTAYSDLMKDCSTLAPRVPRRNPMMFTMITTAAVNSILSPCFMQMMRDIAIVSMVRKSSSSMPASLQTNATQACRRAKICMIPAVFNSCLMQFRSQISTKVITLSRLNNHS